MYVQKVRMNPGLNQQFHIYTLTLLPNNEIQCRRINDPTSVNYGSINSNAISLPLAHDKKLHVKHNAATRKKESRSLKTKRLTLKYPLTYVEFFTCMIHPKKNSLISRKLLILLYYLKIKYEFNVVVRK